MTSFCARGTRAVTATLLLFAAAAACALPVAALASPHAPAGATTSPTSITPAGYDTRAVRLPLADLEAALPADGRLQLFTVTDRPGLYLMQTASLAQQGAMFSRVVALLERRDMPRNRVASTAAIAAHARRFGTDPAGLTAGNNFSTVELAHFFEIARQQHVVLSPGERALQTILVRWGLMREEEGGWSTVSARDFLITIPGLGPAPHGETIDATVRAAILSHELGHWQYFSNSAYAHACRSFWWQALNYDERAELTRQLENLGYDPSDRIVIDEMQAYLLHTPAAYMPIVDVQGAGGIDVAKVRRQLQAWVAKDGQ